MEKSNYKKGFELKSDLPTKTLLITENPKEARRLIKSKRRSFPKCKKFEYSFRKIGGKYHVLEHELEKEIV